MGLADGSREGADQLDIRISGKRDEKEERKVLTALLQSFSTIATHHGLVEQNSESREGVLLFYLHAGATTHAIHVRFDALASSVGVPGGYQSGSARLAIILDDLGADRSVADAIFALPYPLTVSILPNHEHSVDIAEEAHRRGYQVMLHLPMQSFGKETPEAQELRPGMSATELGSLVSPMLESFPYIAGVNNHQGSQATADPALMQALMPLLRENHVFYIDSRTTAATVAFDTARNSGVRCAFRSVPFLDDVQELPAIRRQLEIAIRAAKRTGEAVAIGHPHPATLKALSEVLPRAAAQGVRLVHASELVH
ncbi:MAG: divergent polysaccharide deacetylase family protein [Candidatus Acidiferrum sp.]